VFVAAAAAGAVFSAAAVAGAAVVGAVVAGADVAGAGADVAGAGAWVAGLQAVNTRVNRAITEAIRETFLNIKASSNSPNRLVVTSSNLNVFLI
jgi:hypothetical protein